MGSKSPDQKSKKKKKSKKERKKKSKSKSSSRSSLKETGAFERVLNNYHSSGSVNAISDEQWLNLALELKPLDQMVDDRDRLMKEVFAVLGGDQQLNELLPEVIRKANHSSEEIRELLVSECKQMTNDEILDVLKGRKAVVPANSKSDAKNKHMEKVTTDDLTKSFLQVDPAASGEPTPSQMELLELEMRARAIKSLMHQQTVPENPVVSENPSQKLTSGQTDDTAKLNTVVSVTSSERRVSSSSIDKAKSAEKATENVIEPLEPSSVTATSEEVAVSKDNAIISGEDKNANVDVNSEKSKINVLSDDLLITEISDEEMEPL